MHVTWSPGWPRRLHLHTSYRSQKLWADTGTLQTARTVHEDHKTLCLHRLFPNVLGENRFHLHVQPWCLEKYGKATEADSPRPWTFCSPAAEWRLSVSEPSGPFHPPPCGPPGRNQTCSAQALETHSQIKMTVHYYFVELLKFWQEYLICPDMNKLDPSRLL